MLSVLRHGELCVCVIMEVLHLPQSTASRHLVYLRNAGWLIARRQNKWMYYRFSTASVVQAIAAGVITYLTSLHQLQEEMVGATSEQTVTLSFTTASNNFELAIATSRK